MFLWSSHNYHYTFQPKHETNGESSDLSYTVQSSTELPSSQTTDSTLGVTRPNKPKRLKPTSRHMRRSRTTTKTPPSYRSTFEVSWVDTLTVESLHYSPEIPPSSLSTLGRVVAVPVEHRSRHKDPSGDRPKCQVSGREDGIQ